MYLKYLTREPINDGRLIRLSGFCRVTRQPYSVIVKPDDLKKYEEHEIPVQRAFPYLKAADREFLISGCSPTGWKELFGSDEEEDV